LESTDLSLIGGARSDLLLIILNFFIPLPLNAWMKGHAPQALFPFAFNHFSYFFLGGRS
jgi:riboflavin transporter FmnP